MNFIKKFKGTIVVIGMFAIVLAINFYYPDRQDISTDIQVNELVNENFTEETVESAETQEIIIPVTEDVPIETTDHMENEIKEIVTPTSIPPLEMSEPDAEIEIQEESVIPTSIPPLEMSEPDAEIEIQEESVIRSTLFCSLTIRCDTLLDNMDSIAPEKIHLIPESGSILPETELEFSEGESAFDILVRELKKHNIHFEFSKAPMYDSVYIESIGNLYEFDAGELSGWIYRVNGKILSVGCSQYKLKSGDKIEFLYTCNMGKDL